jgi:opacity protein-like surface antigen
MKRVGLAGVSLLALATVAAAADLPRRSFPGPGPAYIPVYNWTGFYIGINGGGAWGDSTWDSIGTFDVAGFLVGGTAGYNWQAGQFVFGLEGDYAWTGIDGTSRARPARPAAKPAIAGSRPSAAASAMPMIDSSRTSRAVSRSATSRRTSPASSARMTSTRMDARRWFRVCHRRAIEAKAEYLISISAFNSGPPANGINPTTCRSARTWCAAA